jgi:hypothetical protein
LDNAKIIADAVTESLRLLAALPNDKGMRDEATAVRLMADTYEGTASIDLLALDKRLRRMRIAAVSGKYPDKWLGELGSSN